MSTGPGSRLGPYEIRERIGAGGMGVVYRARHTRLERDVAIKILGAAVSADRNRVARLEREARIASALNHPGIVTIYDIGEHDGVTYIAMEAIDGRTLADIIADGPIELDEALRLAVQLADALAKAHDAGIVHRDIKPANVMVTSDGLAKVLDFGIARPPAATHDIDTPSTGRLDVTIGSATMTATVAGELVGTPNYMSPEQLTAGTIDHRTDQFAFGALLYEMLCGEPAFRGLTIEALISAILTIQPTPLRRLRDDIPEDVERVVTRCLEKDADHRFESMSAVGAALRAIADRRERRKHGIIAKLRRPAVAIPLIATVVLAGVASGMYVSGAERRWAEREALEDIDEHIENGNIFEAYRVALIAEKYRPADPDLERLFGRISLPVTINTTPSGAEVRLKGYMTPDAPWEYMGTTPLEMRLPYAMARVQIALDGYETVEGAPFSGPSVLALANGMRLDPVGTVPAGMVRVPGSRFRVPFTVARPDLPNIESFFLDRYETTNREYREFIESGGYSQPEFWPDSIVRDGRAVSWAEAIASFTDTTGTPGPAGWQRGTYPVGEDDHPVGGLSWFEAVAYCRFRGRQLPTVYHWFNAIGQDQLSDILSYSNLDGTAAAPVGTFHGVAAWGNYDMAGNVREWAWNSIDIGWHYLLGTAWNEPGYMFRHPVAQDPWDRSITNGVRCALYPEPVPDELLAPATPRREYIAPSPISDSEFELLRGLYEYDPSPLEPRIVRVDSTEHYRREVVSVRTAYDADRMEIHLLFPHDPAPPLQSVIWFPGDDVFLFRSSESFASAHLFDFIPGTGRVLVYPVYSGMYERWTPDPTNPSQHRDRIIRWSKDIGRTIDYLETRTEFDADHIAFYGFSGGAIYGPVFTAIEPRLSAAILLGGGLTPVRARPEAHPVHFAPRSRTPTLMINGENDFLMPYEVSQLGLFELLGAPPDRKRHARLPGGHIPSRRQDIEREVLDWLDRW